MNKLLSILCFFTISSIGVCFAQKTVPSVAFNQDWNISSEQFVNVAVKGNKSKVLESISTNGFFKYAAKDWLYIRTTLSQIKIMFDQKIITNLYYPNEKPTLLADTMRALVNADSVHLGLGGLQVPYTGKDVIVGVIDTGIDFNHDDFKNPDGTTRVLYYWDHSLPNHATRTPPKYGYGQLWTANDIDNSLCTSMDNSAHGSTVTGAAVGNGRATGFGKGVAPDANIIVVETNFSLPNWSLTIADAVDFIFSMADTLNMPAVVNASIGNYLGSHDGKDPATLVIDSLLNDKNGRIMVCAGGNSGIYGPYHVNGTASIDTTFTWLKVNPSSTFGFPAVYFDLWSDTVDCNQMKFAMGADQRDPYEFIAHSNFLTIQDFYPNAVIEDTIRNSSGDRIATLEWYGEIVDGRFHVELLLKPDSLDYYYRFMTAETGQYQLWSGSFLGLNDIPYQIDSIPLIGDFPAMQYYQYPDDLSTIVSGWACSRNVVTVGNYQNRKSYEDVNGLTYTAANTALDITPTSSKGPTRDGWIKPDVAAPGDLIMSAAPLWIIPSLISQSPSPLLHGGMHMRNGGTSMASPVVAGIAALYLERCNNASYADFIADLKGAAFDDNYTGTTPNMTWGYGKVNALHTLNRLVQKTSIIGDTAICDGNPAELTVDYLGSAYDWSNGNTSAVNIISSADTISVIVYDMKSCKNYSDTVVILEGITPDPAVISDIGSGYLASPAYNYEWFNNNTKLNGENNQLYVPSGSGSYYAILYDSVGCSATTNSLMRSFSSLEENDETGLLIYPNPVENELTINISHSNIAIYSTSGQIIYKNDNKLTENNSKKIDVSNWSKGVYFVVVTNSDQNETFKIVKQ